jgi:predicted metal-dependent phosphoesterase TrpH
MAVTDHDTTAAVAEVRTVAREHGILAVAGIEITAVDDQRDTHVLGYFFDPEDEALRAFLLTQRATRVERVRAIGALLAALGVPIHVESLVRQATAGNGRSIGRPQVARAMMEAGHVASVQEAFDRWLAEDRPGFVPRTGASSAAVIGAIHAAGGIASLAHPGEPGLEWRVKVLAQAGLDAVEVFHPDHDAALVERYYVLARVLRLLMTGGSDFHGDPEHGGEPGDVSVPVAEFERLRGARPDAFG